MAFIGGQHLDGTFRFHQRRSKQQPADELAGHIPRQGEPARTQPPKHSNALGGLLKAQALAIKQHLVHGLGAVKQPPRAGEAHLLRRQAEQRDHKTQGSSRSRCKKTGRVTVTNPPELPRPVMVTAARLLRHLGAQLGHSAQGGADVLAVLNIGNVADPIGQRRAQNSAVCRTFAGRHGGLAA